MKLGYCSLCAVTYFCLERFEWGPSKRVGTSSLCSNYRARAITRDRTRERELNLYSISMNCSSWCYLGFQWWEVQIIPSKRTMDLHLLTSLANYTPQNMSPPHLAAPQAESVSPSLSHTHANFVIFFSLWFSALVVLAYPLYVRWEVHVFQCEHKR